MKLRVKNLIVAAAILAGFKAINAFSDPFTAEHLVRLDRVSAPAISPDGEHVAYVVRKTDMEADKGRTDIWVSPADGGEAVRLTKHEANDGDPNWSPDGQYVWFISTRSGSAQVWRMNIENPQPEQVTDLPVDIGTFRLAPRGDQLVFSARVYLDCEDLACTRDRDEARKTATSSALVYSQLFMRHWDHWLDEKRSQLFVLPLAKEAQPAGPPVRVTRVDADIPSRVWGGAGEYAISPDGLTVYFAARLRDETEPTSTNFDIYAAPMNADGENRNLTEDNAAWDTAPVLSPDGQKLAWLAMSRPGFEADQFQVMIRDLATGKTRNLAGDWDRSPSSIIFTEDGKFLLADAQDVGQKTLWKLDTKDGSTQRITREGYVSAMTSAKNRVVFARSTLRSPDELFSADLDGDDVRQITHFSRPQLEDVELGDYEQFSFEGADGHKVYGFVVKPVNYTAEKTYPVAFIIHGGPQGSSSNRFHYRWNPQTYAGQGFAVVMIDFHGSTGYGQKFTDSISGDWGGKPLLDLQLGLAASLDQYDFLEDENICALGASYGGYMINWIAGNWPERFKCLVNHDGIFDNRSMYYTTEELWFPEWEHSGPYFQAPAAHERHNPVNHVDKWQTPMLVIHGELDYRVPVTQGIATFTALQRRGIESRFVYFPDENHWVLKPGNSVRWHQEVNSWLHRFLGD